jgi:hypothetical protein
MKRSVIFPAIIVCAFSFAFAQDASQLVGTWNVQSTPTGDFSGEIKTGRTASAYIWLVSVSPNGEIQVSVQGETGFPKLSGRWYADKRIWILEGRSSGLGGRTACWIKLSLDRNGVFHGVRRYLDNSPSFADFEIIAKKS